MIPSGLRRKYRAHVNSARWRNTRRDLIRWRGARCERCGATGTRLCLHHRTYERFGRERPTDLELLCCQCHKPADSERRGKRIVGQSATILNFEAHRLHALKRAGNNFIWFVLADVCEILGIERSDDVAARLDADQKGAVTIRTPGGPQRMIVVSEDGVYEIACTSRKPIAKRFSRWLYREVLPEIRQTGAYAGGAEPLNALIGEIQLSFDLAEPKARDNVVPFSEAELPIIDPAREEAELEAELQRFNQEFSYDPPLPKGLVFVDEKQRQAYLKAWRLRHHNGPNQLQWEEFWSDTPQVCYGPGGILVERG